MKRLDKSQSRRFGPLKLGLDSVRELLVILEPAEGLTIVADGVEYESVEELAAYLKGKSPRELKINTSHPYVSVELAPMDARLYVASSDLLSSGVFARAAEVLARSERRPRWLYKDSRIFILGGF